MPKIPTTEQREDLRLGKKVVLSDSLVASSHGEKIAENYRATLESKSQYNGRLSITVEQWVRGEWYGTGGSWFLSTLMKNKADSISIDFGQRWSIDSGMKEAIEFAIEFI